MRPLLLGLLILFVLCVGQLFIPFKRVDSNDVDADAHKVGKSNALSCMMIADALIREHAQESVSFARRISLFFIVLRLVIVISNHLDEMVEHVRSLNVVTYPGEEECLEVLFGKDQAPIQGQEHELGWVKLSISANVNSL